MKSLRLRLALWFGLSFLLVAVVFSWVTYQHLEDELRRKTWQTHYPTHPDWRIHGSYSEAEVQDILGELFRASLTITVPLVLLATVIGFWLARKSLQPIASINHQLQTKTSKNLGVPIQLSEADAEFRDLLAQLNDLLKRLDVSFAEMNSYAAKVAHELRTPLAILRLKVEQAERGIAPDLAEELHTELHRLSHIVDQSLLIARAERGRLQLQRRTLDLYAIVLEIVEDFDLLAREQDRRLRFIGAPGVFVQADERHLRQIIHNLLTNALKHGQGDFVVRVKPSLARPSLTIVNRMEWCPVNVDFTLGLGLRVVTVLLRSDPNVRFRSRRGNAYYAVRLSLPPASAVAVAERIRTGRTIRLQPASAAVQEDENYFI